MNRNVLWALGIAGFLFAGYIGMWSASLFTISESMHISVNFPAGANVPSGQQMDCCDLGGTWQRKYGADWNDYPSGGVLVWGEEGEVLIDLGKMGWLKRVLQPRYFNLSSHWIRNVGLKPYKLRMEMDLCGIEPEWVTFEAAWDPVTRTTTRYIEPGKTYNMDWYFHIPEAMFDRSEICQGEFALFDADTGEPLSVLPITLINSRAQ